MEKAIETEITSYLLHKDYSLAQRRILDASLDTGNDPLIYEAINWSREYRQSEKESIERGLSAELEDTARTLINKIGVAGKGAISQSYSLIDAKEISKTYRRGNFSLQPISLKINTGDIMGVVGENGNGKTTLLRCLAGQLALNRGSIDYKLLNHPDFYNIKNHVAFIPQRIPRWYGLLKDNLHFSASLAGVTGDKNKMMVAFMLERLNLTEYAHLTWSEISSGYRTRFEIARILLQKPRLLILDEPLANLDINAQQTILTDLKFIAKSLHNPMGIILSSQQLHEVEKIADTVLFIKQGTGIFNTISVSDKNISFALEVETTASRELLLQVLGENAVHVQFNGGFYTLTSSQHTSQEILSKLVSNNISMTYFRDITYSTKRLF